MSASTNKLKTTNLWDMILEFLLFPLDDLR